MPSRADRGVGERHPRIGTCAADNAGGTCAADGASDNLSCLWWSADLEEWNLPMP